MARSKRLELNSVCIGFKGFKNVVNWWIDKNEVLWVETKRGFYSARKYFGTYGFITRHC